MSLWDALRMNMMISYQELVRTFHSYRTDFSFRCAAFKLNKIGLNIATLWMPLGL